MKVNQLIILFVCIGLSMTSLRAQVVINEFSAANYDAFLDNYGEYEDYIELYNTSSSPVDLSGYYLSDKLTNLDKWEIPAGVVIQGNDHLLIWCDDRNEVTGNDIHSNFKITQTKQNEAVVFSDPNLQIIDFHDIDDPCQMNHAWARTTDGGATWGIETNPSPGNSNTNVSAYYAEKPQIAPAAGLFSGSVEVTINVTDPNVTVHYTLDGDEPEETDPVYTGPITLNQTTVVRAKGFSSDSNVPPSFIETNTYFVDDTHTISVLSISGSGLPNLLGGSWGAEPQGHFEYFDANQVLIHEALGEYNKHGNDSWAYDQRGVDFIVRDQFGHDYAVHDQIFPNKTRTEFQRLILKAAANDNYPFEDGAHVRDSYVHTLSQRAGMEMDERTSKFCIIYMNGQYWGVYDMREKVDDNDFTQFYYNQGRKWIDFIKTWGATWAEYGDMTDWNTLHNYIITNDMSVQANYDYVTSQLEVESLVDYIILNTHVVCSDWLNWNTAWWRGRNPDGQKQRWRYALWDMDATFGHYINYTGVPDTGPQADPCDPEELDSFGDPEGHVEMLTSLYENDDFYNLYINRYADLNNTYFTCEYMEGLLDEMVAEISPEMPRQIARWGGTMQGWLDNVEDLRAFIQTRCTIIDTGITDCYEVTGPYTITVNVDPVGSPNDVQVNTVIPLAYPYQGDYFGGTDMTLTAQPATGWFFNYWTVANHTFGPDQYADAISMAIQTNDNVVAFFSNIPNPPGQGNVSYNGCLGDGYSVIVNGTTYDENNPTGTEVIIGGAYDGQDSTVVVNLTFNPESTGVENYIGDEGDGYSVSVNGTLYDESNPSGTEVLVNAAGCDSTVTINLVFTPVTPGIGNETYLGCQGDGYSVTVNGTVYSETNPTGTETIVGGAANGQDSTVNINLIFNPNSTGLESYMGDEGDGYSVTVNGTVYNEANPTGTETLTNYLGCDSIVTVNLMFSAVGCAEPTNFNADIDFDNVEVTWQGPSNAEQYLIRYRRVLETTWNETSQFSPMYNLFGLVPCGNYLFQVKSVCSNGIESDYVETTFATGCNVDVEDLPNSVGGVDVYPNPFRQNVVIDMTLLDASEVQIGIFDVRGQLVYQSNQGQLGAGKHIISIDALSNLSSGVYFVKMNVGNDYLVRELVKMN